MEFAGLASVLVAMTGLLKLTLTALDRQRRGFEKFLGNHMSANTKALKDVSTALEHLAHEVRRGCDQCEGRGYQTK